MSLEYEIVIGLEVHVEIATESKIFCGCATRFGSASNTQTCPVCLGLPGTLPVLNKKVLEQAMRAALALGSKISEYTKFDRKNYFYPDLPKAYQISQYDKPLSLGGKVTINTSQGEKKIGITRLHLEEDAGKLLHQSSGGQIGTAQESLVDYNRAGIPLIEIVSEPDMRSAEEAYNYLVNLKAILEYAQISDCNMEEGSLRCDANISLRPKGQKQLGVKVEIKNMNSFKNIKAALEYEVRRQSNLLASDEKITQETRLWDTDKQITLTMRSKEEAHDYRYFPEPDLPPLKLTQDMQQVISASLPELPLAKKTRFKKEYTLSDYDINILTTTRELADFFEASVKSCSGVQAKNICNWITVELLGKLNSENKKITQSPITPKDLAELVNLIERGNISGKIAKEVFAKMYTTAKSPQVIVEEQGLSQISNTEELGQMVATVIQANPAVVKEYQQGKKQALGFLVGQIMKISKGQANPKIINQLLKEKLD